MKIFAFLLLFCFSKSVEIILQDQKEPPFMPFSYPFNFHFSKKSDYQVSKYKWMDTLKDFQPKCQNGKTFVYLTKMPSPNSYLHLLSLIKYFENEEKKILGIEIGQEMSGFISKCENIQYFIQYFKGVNDLNLDIALNEFIFKEKRFYRYRYDIKTFKLNTGFNIDECRVRMLSPCDGDDPFEFRPERTISVDIALKDPFFNTFLQSIKFDIFTGQGSCQNICSSKGKRCFNEGYSIVNNCRVMKKYLGCIYCQTYDEGDDHPFSYDNRCRLMSFFGFNCHKPGPGLKICPCLE